MGRTLVLNGQRIDLDAVRGVLDGSITRLQLAATAVRAVERSHRVVERIVEERRPVYGISTGYGRLQDIAVPPET
ncbi:MAG: aromatic amino acid lyase, partial [Planctomycetota bacterium]